MELVEPTMLVVLALVAFVAGFIDAVAGGGGQCSYACTSELLYDNLNFTFITLLC